MKNSICRAERALTRKLERLGLPVTSFHPWQRRLSALITVFIYNNPSANNFRTAKGLTMKPSHHGRQVCLAVLDVAGPSYPPPLPVDRRYFCLLTSFRVLFEAALSGVTAA